MGMEICLIPAGKNNIMKFEAKRRDGIEQESIEAKTLEELELRILQLGWEYAELKMITGTPWNMLSSTSREKLLQKYPQGIKDITIQEYINESI